MVTTVKRKPPSQEAHTRLPYDVAFVDDNGNNSSLEPKEHRALVKAFGKQPTQVFLTTYERGLNAYVKYEDAVARVGPGKVSKRLKQILTCGESLRDAIQDLELSDRSFIGKFWCQQFLADEESTSENEFLKALTLFMGNVQSAYVEVGSVQRKGAMPAYAKQALALSIAQALYLENGKFPGLTRGGVFDQVLRCAINTGNSRTKISKAREDVMPLMRFARDNFDEDGTK